MSRQSNGQEPGKTKVALSAVPETMLWPLWNRAAETQVSNPIIRDPMAVELLDKIDYDFAGRFGKPTVFHAIRARVCDDMIRAFAARHGGETTVVALGEGLETQFWRLEDEKLCWLSVDLPEAVELRRRLLPSSSKMTHLPCSALDPMWMDQVPSETPPFISAAGLLMYFSEQEVCALLSSIAKRFPGAALFFDTIAPKISQKTKSGLKITKGYTAPEMPWGIAIDDLPDFIRSIPGLKPAEVMTYSTPFPHRTRLYGILEKITWLRRSFASGLVRARVED